MSYESEMSLLLNLAMTEKGLDENDPIVRARITMELIDRMIKKTFIILFCFALVAPCFGSTDIDNLFNYSWDCYFQYYPPINEPWQFCRTVIFSPSGDIFNRNETIKIGEWRQDDYNSDIIHIMISECGKLKGYFQFVPGSCIFEGPVTQANPGSQQKLAKFLMVRR